MPGSRRGAFAVRDRLEVAGAAVRMGNQKHTCASAKAIAAAARRLPYREAEWSGPVAANTDAEFDADLLVAEVMRRWPATIRVFLRLDMACPGCPMAPFVTLTDAAGAYNIATEHLVHDLRAAIARAESGEST